MTQSSSAPGRALARSRCASCAGCSASPVCGAARGLLHRPGRAADQAPTPITNDYRLRHPITFREGTRDGRAFRRQPARPAHARCSAPMSLASAQRWRREATGGIIIDVPAGTANEPAARHARCREIRSILAGRRRSARTVSSRAPIGPTDPGSLATLRINYPTMDGRPPDLAGCGRTISAPASTASTTTNVAYWNFGCCLQRNLAAMVDNPADLVQPRGETPTYTPRRTYALDKYRKGETDRRPPIRSRTTAKISDVGK